MEVIPLGPGFCAEVRGAGLADVAAHDDVYAAVRAAFEEHSVLLFRRQPITDELQVAYSQRFGPLEIAKAASLGEGTPFSILTNIDRATGKLVPPDHKEALRARANQLWHTDSSFKVPPALASVLSARANSAARRRNGIRVDAARVGPLVGNRAQRVVGSLMHGTTTRIRAARSRRSSPPSASARCRPCAGACAGSIRSMAAPLCM